MHAWLVVGCFTAGIVTLLMSTCIRVWAVFDREIALLVSSAVVLALVTMGVFLFKSQVEVFSRISENEGRG